MDDLPTPTTRELEILKVLWEHGAKSVSDVHKLLKPTDGKQQAVNTVQTLIRIMEGKGLVTHETMGRTFIYRPMFSRDESAVRFLDRVFDGAASQLMLSLLNSEKISPAELAELQTMIASARHTEAVR